MIVITTPTGAIGSQVLSNLLQHAGDEQLRVVVRDPARLPPATRDRVEVVVGSHGEADVVDRAFEGAGAVFWVAPPNPAATRADEDTLPNFTRAAAHAFAEHDVGHVVGVSALGRGTDVAGRAGLVTESLAMDDLIAGTGVAYRALANPGFMDNLLRQVTSIRDEGVFTWAASADRTAPYVATGDIAAVATKLLLDRSWSGSDSVPVLGPADLSPNDMAATISEVLDTPVRYEVQSLEELRAQLTQYGMGQGFVTAMVDMMRAKDQGLDAGVERTTETSSPISFKQWCHDVLQPATAA